MSHDDHSRPSWPPPYWNSAPAGHHDPLITERRLTRLESNDQYHGDMIGAQRRRLEQGDSRMDLHSQQISEIRSDMQRQTEMAAAERMAAKEAAERRAQLRSDALRGLWLLTGLVIAIGALAGKIAPEHLKGWMALVKP
jgi:hypothetical protein